MAMFSFSKRSFEKRMSGKLQDRFVTIVIRNKILAKWAGVHLGLKDKELKDYMNSIVRFHIFIPNDWVLVLKIKRDFKKEGIIMDYYAVYNKLITIEKRLNRAHVKRSLPKNIV